MIATPIALPTCCTDDRTPAAEPDEEPGARRQPAGERGEREQLQAEGEHSPASVVIAEAPAEDQPGGERKSVPGNYPLDRRRGGTQVRLHCRHGDIHDEEVEGDHKRPGQYDRERQPPVPILICRSGPRTLTAL